jgi:acetyl-CoA C-acetyltransferase
MRHVDVLRKMGGRRGIAALCHGTGGATALAIEFIYIVFI